MWGTLCSPDVEGVVRWYFVMIDIQGSSREPGLVRCRLSNSSQPDNGLLQRVSVRSASLTGCLCGSLCRRSNRRVFENNLKTLGGLCVAASAVIDSSVAWAGQPESNYATVWLVWCSQCNVDSSVAWAVQPEPNYAAVWLVWCSQRRN